MPPKALSVEQERTDQGFVRVGTFTDEGLGACSGIVQFGGGEVLLAGAVQRWVGSSGSSVEGDDVSADAMPRLS